MINRQDLSTTIKELKGKVVEDVQVVRSVRNNAPPDVVLVLLKVKGGNWHRVFLDADTLFWEEMKSIDPSDVDLEPTADRTFALEHLESVVGKTLGVIKMDQGDEGGVLTVPLPPGASLVLQCRDAGLDEEHTVLTLTG